MFFSEHQQGVRARLDRWAAISREAWVYSEQFVIIRFILNCPTTARLTRQIPSALSIHINDIVGLSIQSDMYNTHF